MTDEEHLAEINALSPAAFKARSEVFTQRFFSHMNFGPKGGQMNYYVLRDGQPTNAQVVKVSGPRAKGHPLESFVIVAGDQEWDLTKGTAGECLAWMEKHIQVKQ